MTEETDYQRRVRLLAKLAILNEIRDRANRINNGIGSYYDAWREMRAETLEALGRVGRGIDV